LYSFSSHHYSQFWFFEVIKVLLVGLVNDIFVFILASSILALYFLFLSNSKYKNLTDILFWSIGFIFPVHLAYSQQYFQAIWRLCAEIALVFVGIKIFLRINAFLPTQRIKIRNVLYFITLLLYVLVIIFNGVSEYFFYNEFGVRYNFIAVDYLITPMK
jgi:hypothetical protein